MSEESDIEPDNETHIIDISDLDDVDTNTEDLNDVDKLLITTKEESIVLFMSINKLKRKKINKWRAKRKRKKVFKAKIS